jgi:hypothetical protein
MDPNLRAPATGIRKTKPSGLVFSMKFALRASEMFLRNVKYATRAKYAAAYEGKFYITFCTVKYIICPKGIYHLA